MSLPLLVGTAAADARPFGQDPTLDRLQKKQEPTTKYCTSQSAAAAAAAAAVLLLIDSLLTRKRGKATKRVEKEM